MAEPRRSFITEQITKLFGFGIKREESPQDNLVSFTPRETDDGALTVAAGGSYGQFLDLEGSAKTEADLIVRYRDMAIQPECEQAIEDIMSEAIVKVGNEKVLDINLDDCPLDPSVKDAILQQWEKVSELLEINTSAYDIFRRWYIDGRIRYHAIIDTKNPRAGLQEMRYIDPRKIRKVRQIQKERKDGVYIAVDKGEYYIYQERGFKGSSVTGLDNQGLMISPDSIVEITSGLVDKDNKMVLGFLHKAIKPLNQLRIMEDATVIYRISRAPERRIFNIDVGNLPKMKAEQFVRDQMVKHKNRLIYDATTGETKDDRKFMTMIEDYWFPQRDGKGTTVTNLPAGANLGEMTDVRYFEEKLYRSLNVPVSHILPETGFSLGRSSEITRDELKFQKFITRLRSRFSQLFLQTLKRQLILTGVLTTQDWESIKNKVHFDYRHDNFFAELKDEEILRERIVTLQAMDPYVGKYYSMEWIKKNVLHQSDEDIEQMEEEMGAEREMMGEMQMEMDPNLQMQQQALDQQGEEGGPPGGGKKPPAKKAKPTKEGKKDKKKPSGFDK